MVSTWQESDMPTITEEHVMITGVSSLLNSSLIRSYFKKFGGAVDVRMLSIDGLALVKLRNEKFVKQVCQNSKHKVC